MVQKVLTDITVVHMPYVDMEPSRRLAYAFVEPACADPGLYIRLSLERHGWLLLPTAP
jgi:hypothetical protein